MLYFDMKKKVATRHKSLERKCETEVWERKNSIKRSNEKLEKRRIKRVGIIPRYRCDKGTLNDYYTSDSNNKFHIRWRIGKRYQNAFEKCLDFFVVLLQLVCHLNCCSNRRNYMILVMVKGFCGRSNNDTHSQATIVKPTYRTSTHSLAANNKISLDSCQTDSWAHDHSTWLSLCTFSSFACDSFVQVRKLNAFHHPCSPHEHITPSQIQLTHRDTCLSHINSVFIDYFMPLLLFMIFRFVSNRISIYTQPNDKLLYTIYL